MPTENLGASFEIDVSSLKAGLAQANRLIRESESEFKAAAAGMDDWTKSEEGLTASLKNLNKVQELQQKKVNALQAQYNELIANGLDPASREAVQLRTNINKEQEALAKTQKKINDQTQALAAMADETSDNVSASQKLRNEIDKQGKELDDLQQSYADVVLEQGKNSDAAKELKAKISSLSSELNENKSKLKDATSALDDAGNAAEESGDGFTVAKGAVAGFIANGLTALVGAAKNAISSLLNLADETKEFRQDMATLETAFDSAGFHAAQAEDTWRNLYGVFGEDDRAVEAANNISRMAKNQEDLDKWVRITTGIWGTYQDALPVEGLAEAAGETAKVGQVTGVFADALNWSSDAAKMFSKYMSEDVTNAEDAFNVALSECTTEQERQALITDTLTALYGDAADKYNETAASTIEANKAAADLQQTQAELGEKIQPVSDAVKKGISGILISFLEAASGTEGADLAGKISEGFDYFNEEVVPKIIDGFNWIIDNKDTIIAGIAGIGAAFAAFKVVTLVQAVTSALKGMTLAQAALNVVMSLNPIGLVVAAIAGLVAAFVILWKKCDGFRNFFLNMFEKIKEVVSAAGEWFSNLAQSIGDGISSAWEFVKGILSTVGTWINDNVIQPVVQFFTDLWNGIVAAYNAVIAPWVEIIRRAAAIVNEEIIQPIANFFVGLFEKVKTDLKNAWDFCVSIYSAVAGWFNSTVIQPLKNAFNAVWTPLKEGAQKAWNKVKEIFGKVADFFGSVFSKAWQKVKDVFSVGGKIFDGIKEGIASAFTTIVNTIIRGINKVVKIPFDAINTSLEKIKGTEILGVKPFNWISTISVPKIPELAKGGIVDRATHFVAGEDGKEAVLPLEKNTGWIDMLADKIAEKSGGVVVNQTNNYSQAHSRLEIYKSKQQTAAAVRLAMARG